MGICRKNMEVWVMNTTFQDMLDSFHKISPRISELRSVKLDSSWHHEMPYTTPESRIYYICKGEADITCNGKPYHMTPGNIYFLPAGSNYTYRCETSMEKLFLHVSMLRRNGYDLFNQVKECVVLTDRKQEIDRLCRCVDAADLHSVLVLKAHLHALMLEVMERAGVELGQPEAYTALTYRAIEYIENHLRCGLTLEQVAKGLQVPQSRLVQTFRKDMGVTMGKYITDRLMCAAEAVLRTGDESIHAVSERFGFCDQFYFSRKFTDYFGVAPQKYRRRSRPGRTKAPI